MDLCKTVAMMVSKDYRERFKAEVYQVNERVCRLIAMLDAWDAGKLGFEPTTPKDTLRRQLDAMTEYRAVLLERAELEGIELDQEEFDGETGGIA